MNSMDRVNEKINLQDIKEFENRCGIKLPSEYIDFLLKYNGGYPKASTFKISEEQGETVVNKFYGIGNMKGNLDKVYEVLDGELPEGFISIGSDPGGNEICIGVSEKYFGKIYFWIHDMESDQELSNMFFLANSFNEFFENLYNGESI